jgi:hypothetical protein
LILVNRLVEFVELIEFVEFKEFAEPDIDDARGACVDCIGDT